jgi:glycylpeptide N-tetradecanoyltransferase
MAEETKLASDLAGKSLEDPSSTSQAADALRDGAPAEDGEEDVEGEEEDGEEEHEDGEAAAGAEGAAKAKKKKKPKKKKKKAAADAVAPASPETKMQNMPKTVPVHDIPSLLQQLSLQQAQSKKEGKAPEDYKFWNTQPVPKFKEPNLLQTTDGASGQEQLPEGAYHRTGRSGAKR